MIEEKFRLGCGCSFNISKSEATNENLDIRTIACPSHMQLMLGYTYRLADEIRYRNDMIEKLKY